MCFCGCIWSILANVYALKKNKRYLNTLISGYVNIMSIFALQCCLNFKKGWMFAILTKINSIHSHLSFRVCMYKFSQYTWCVAAVLMANFPWNTENWVEIQTAAIRFPTKKCLFDFLPNVVNLRTELHIPRVYLRLLCCCCTFDVNWICCR